MEKNRLIIVEGPQGTGKTTLVNYLRENISGSNLYRLSGQKEKGMEGKKNSEHMYNALINYLSQMANIPMDLIFDRTFFSEEIYARLGYKDYEFTDIFYKLFERMLSLDYDIYYFTLYLEKTELFLERLKRDSHHNYQTFSVQNSINQQNEYLRLLNELKKYENDKFHLINLSMDDFEVSYRRVKQILNINGENKK